MLIVTTKASLQLLLIPVIRRRRKGGFCSGFLAWRAAPLTPGPVSSQLAVFRSLLFTSAEEEVQKSMVNNFRVQQPLCGRTVRSSFTSFLQEAASAEANKQPH